MIVTVPVLTPVTVAGLPLADTVATPSSLLFHEKEPPDGVPVAVKLAVLPAPHIEIGFGLIVTVQVRTGEVELQGDFSPEMRW